MMSMLLAAGLILAPAASAAAQTAAPRAATSPEIVVQSEKFSKRQCREMVVSGSRMPRKVCKAADGAPLLMPGVANNIGTRAKDVSGREGEVTDRGE